MIPSAYSLVSRPDSFEVKPVQAMLDRVLDLYARPGAVGIGPSFKGDPMVEVIVAVSGNVEGKMQKPESASLHTQREVHPAA